MSTTPHWHQRQHTHNQNARHKWWGWETGYVGPKAARLVAKALAASSTVKQLSLECGHKQHSTTHNKQTPQHKQHARLVVGQRLPWVRRLQATPPSGHCASLVCSTNTTTCTHPHKTDNNTNTHHKAGNLNKRQASKLRQALQANTTLTALKYDGQHQHHHHVCAPQAKASNKAWQQQTGSRSSKVNGQVLGELVAELTALTTLSVDCEPHQQPQQTLAMDTLWCAGVLATDASQVQPLVAALQHNTNLQRLRLWRWCTTLLTHHTRHTLHTQSTAWWCVCRACAGQQ